MSFSQTPHDGPRQSDSMIGDRGFTLIELIVVVAIVAILAAIALPAYDSYIKKSKAKSAGADLVGLALNFANTFQRTLAYPNENAANTAAVKTLMPGWSPSQDNYFDYSVSDSTATTYTLTATGTGQMTGCTITLKHDNTRNIPTPSKCGGLASW